MSSSSFKRTDRINKQYARLLAEILRTADDKRLRFVNITRVQATSDLRDAKVFYTMISPVPDIQKLLESAQNFLRSELAHRSKMRVTPLLAFYYDDTSDQINLIQSLLK